MNPLPWPRDSTPKPSKHFVLCQLHGLISKNIRFFLVLWCEDFHLDSSPNNFLEECLPRFLPESRSLVQNLAVDLKHALDDPSLLYLWLAWPLVLFRGLKRLDYAQD